MRLPNITQRQRETPEGGWKPHCWYLVEASCRTSNPIFAALLFTGFLSDNGQPAGYSFVMAANGGDPTSVNSFLYIRPIRELYDTSEDFKW